MWGSAPGGSNQAAAARRCGTIGASWRFRGVGTWVRGTVGGEGRPYSVRGGGWPPRGAFSHSPRCNPGELLSVLIHHSDVAKWVGDGADAYANFCELRRLLVPNVADSFDMLELLARQLRKYDELYTWRTRRRPTSPLLLRCYIRIAATRSRATRRRRTYPPAR